METFAPIERHQLFEDEPEHAVKAFVETTGDYDEYLYLTNDDSDDWIVLSPMEARRLQQVIDRWLEEVK